MNNKVYANYASALFESIDKNKVASYKDALKDINNFLLENNVVRSLLCAYKNDCDAVIHEISSSYKLDYLENFLLYIHKKHRFSSFKEIVKEFIHIANDELGIKEGFIYSSVKLDDKTISKVEKTLSKKLNTQVELYNLVDSSLLGGIKVSIDGKVFDNSLKKALEELSNNLLGGDKYEN